MKKNGFSLKGEQLIQKEKPSTLGVLFETLSTIGGLIFFIFYVGIEFIMELGSAAISGIGLIFGGLILGAIVILSVPFLMRA